MVKIVIEEKTKTGKQYLIRYPEKGDGFEMCKYINMLSKEQTFITFQGEEIKLDDEQKYLDNLLKKIKDKKAIVLLVIANNKVVGVSTLDMRDKIESHIGFFGISLAKEYRNQGIGKRLLNLMIDEAKKNLPQLKIITLGVFVNNPVAIKIYEKFGFKKYGSLPEGILHKGKFINHNYMFLKIK